jgi:hypothetical protein
VRIDKSRQERVVITNHSFASLESRPHFSNGSKRHDPARHDRDGVIL